MKKTKTQNSGRKGIPTQWSKIDFEDKRAIVGGGRAGYEASLAFGVKED